MNRRLFFILTGALLIAACNDNDDGFSAGPIATEPTVSDIVTVGTISGFGSVVSNGIHFDTGSVTVIMDGEPAGVADLRAGMIVAIRGTINTQTGAATASEIRFMDDAEGPVSSLNLASNSFVVLGRTVLFDEMTVFENLAPNMLANGNVVQVSGMWRSQDRIQATHIERKANAYGFGMRIEVKGQIRGLDPGQQHFYIGTQLCNYAGATLDLGGADLANGMYVEASSIAPMFNGDMILDQVRLHDRDRDRDHDCMTGCDFELEGFVTAFTSALAFDVDEQPVTTTNNTVYVNGTVDTLALDAKLAVDGTLDENGVLIADRIVFRLPSNVEIEADVEAIDMANTELTLLGIVVTTDEFTLFRDHSFIGAGIFGLEDLATGDRVEVRAYLDANEVLATRLERDDADDNVTLKAPVEAIAVPGVTLLGVTVTSDQDTVFQNSLQETIDADTFFALLEVGDLVMAEGTYDGTTILADKMFIRVCENSCL